MPTYFEGETPTVISSGSNGGCSGFGGMNGDWAMLILLILILGNGNFGGGYGFGGGNNMNSDVNHLSSDLQRGFDTSGLYGRINTITDGITQGFAGVQQSLCQGFGNVNLGIVQNGNETRNAINTMAFNMQNCCCQLGNRIQDVNYNMSMQTNALQSALCNSTRDIIDNNNANFRALHDEIVANRLEDKNAQIQAQQNEINALRLRASQQEQNAYLVDQLKPCPIPSYNVPNPFGCNCGNGCGCNN
jgi:hypothetical protein